MKYLFSFSSCVLFMGFHFSQETLTTKIYGSIKDAKTEQGIPSVSVSIKSTTLAAITNSSGEYSLKNIPEGGFTVVAEGKNYKPQEQVIRIEKNQSLELNFALEEDALDLDEVVVTGGRTGQKRAEAPVIVNVLDSKLLSTTQSGVLGEGLNYCTGLRYENDCQNCGFSQVRMNGMEGPYSQILINSRPIFSGLAGVYGLEFIPANMIERIEIVKGGGSVLYGSNAIAGTINLILKEPKMNFFEAGFNTAWVGAGMKNSNAPAADYSANFNASLVSDNRKDGIAIYGNLRDRKMFDANDDGFSEIAPMKNTVLGARLFHRFSSKSKLSVDFFSINEQRDGGNKQDYPPHERDVAEAVKHDLKSLGLLYERYFREDDMLSVYASGQYLARNSYYGANQSLKGYGYTKDKTYNIGGQYKMKINDISNLVGGIENTGSYLTDTKLGYPDYEHAVGDYVPHTDNMIISDQSLQTAGIFGQYEIKLGKLKLSGGARYEHYSVSDKQGKDNNTNRNVFIPRASVMYNLTSYLQMRFNFSKGYRAPQIFDEDLHIETSGIRQVINRNAPGLKQENSSSFSLSFDFNKKIADVNTSLLIEGFYTRLNNPFQNEIGAPDEDGTVIYTRYNSKHGAVVQGINLELKLSPSKEMSFMGGFTVQSGKYGEPDKRFNKRDFFRTPDAYGYFVFDWEFAPKFGISVTGTYTGRMYVPYFGTEIPDSEAGELRRSKPFFDAGLKFHYDMKFGEDVSIEWYAGVKNIFNSYQNDFDKGINRDPSYIYGPALPKTVFLGFKIGNLL